MIPCDRDDRDGQDECDAKDFPHGVDDAPLRGSPVHA
jgi:hypothetical protein